MFHATTARTPDGNAELVKMLHEKPSDIFINTLKVGGKNAISIIGVFSEKTEKIIKALEGNPFIMPAVCYVGEILECIVTPIDETISVEEEIMKILSNK